MFVLTQGENSRNITGDIKNNRYIARELLFTDAYLSMIIYCEQIFAITSKLRRVELLILAVRSVHCY